MAGTGETSVRSYNFFHDSTIQGTGTYAENVLTFLDQDSGAPFVSHSIMIVNDSGNDIFFRVSAGTTPDHGRVAAGEGLIQDFRRLKAIWLRGTPGDAFRFWAW